MTNQQLIDYIKQQMQLGVSEAQIRDSLISAGWQTQDIEDVFSLISNTPSESVPVPSPRQIFYPLPSAKTIFGQAWDLYKKRLGTFLGVLIIPMLIMAVFFILAKDVFLDTSSFLSKFTTEKFIFLSILFIIVLFITQIWGQTALLYAIKDSQEGIGVIESYRRGWPKIFSYFWTSFLAGFMVFVGFLLLIVPGIIFSVWFSLAIFVLIAENLTGMDALMKSKEYVKGRWGSVFGRLFFITAISQLIYFAPSFLGFLKIPFAERILPLIIGLFLGPMVMSYMFLLYKHLTLTKGKF
jgi:hypothetical protein